MNLEIIVSMKGDTPIYEQIEAQIKEQILAGRLPAGTPIPSMRTLAKMLKVSVITVQRAYEDLKRDGWIESAVGRGTVVAQVDRQQQLEEKRLELEGCLNKALSLARVLGLSVDELTALVRVLAEEEKDE